MNNRAYEIWSFESRRQYGGGRMHALVAAELIAKMESEDKHGTFVVTMFDEQGRRLILAPFINGRRFANMKAAVVSQCGRLRPGHKVPTHLGDIRVFEKALDALVAGW